METTNATNNVVPMTRDEQLAHHGQLLRRSIAKISESANSSIRGIVDRYFNLISPSMVAGGDGRFPTPVRKHGINPERRAPSGHGASKIDVLCFHIGNAILAYYGDCLRQPVEGETFQLSDETQKRGRMLHLIAENGIGNFTIAGSDTEGYFLSHPLSDRIWRKSVQPEKSGQAPVQANGGGGGNLSGPPAVHHGAGPGKSK